MGGSSQPEVGSLESGSQIHAASGSIRDTDPDGPGSSVRLKRMKVISKTSPMNHLLDTFTSHVEDMEGSSETASRLAEFHQGRR